MPSLRQIRLATGLVLYVYVTLHFANHALGNISIGAMENGLAIQKLLWQSLPGAMILYASLLTHMSLGFWALYERRRFRWTRLEATQLVLGLSIPFLLTNHVIGTRVALSQFGIEKGYAQELVGLRVNSPLLGALQAILLLIVWIHGCLGIHFWLRLKPFYPRLKGLLLSIAVLLPALALLGYYQGGERTLEAVKDPAWLARTMSPEHAGAPAQNAVLLAERTRILAFLAVTLAATLSARAFRQWREHRVGSIRLTYPDRTIRVARGRAPPSRRCSSACMRPQASDSPVSFVRPATSRSCPCSPPMRRRSTPVEAGRCLRASNVMWSSCLSTCADQAGWPKGACRSTPCSSSTSFSTP
jgi:adenylate cyclase